MGTVQGWCRGGDKPLGCVLNGLGLASGGLSGGDQRAQGVQLTQQLRPLPEPGLEFGAVCVRALLPIEVLAEPSSRTPTTLPPLPFSWPRNGAPGLRARHD
jgi:hypothetical protein